jgi:hypothetical protein
MKLIGDTFENNIHFKKNTLCHSFHMIVIPFIVLSFLPGYCHSFRIILIPSFLVPFLPNIIIVIPFEFFKELQILTSFKRLTYPKGKKNGYRRWPYMQVLVKFSFSEKAIKICKIFLGCLLSKCSNHKEDCSNFCILLRKAEL